MAKTRIVTRRRVSVEGELNYKDLVALVRAVPGVSSAASITLYVDVPGGGDWSNTELDIAYQPVCFRAEWSESEESDGR